MQLATVGLPVILVAFIALVLVLPLVRQRLRTGIWAVVVREDSGSVETLVRWWTSGLFVALAAWAILVPTVGVAPLHTWTAHPALAWVGIAFVIIGFALVIAAQANMGSSWRIGIDNAPTTLVTTGLFRWVRHPIYTGILAVVVGIAGLTPSPWTICGALLAYVLIAMQSRLEEAHLHTQHGAAYLEWASVAGRFVPRVGRAAV
jgi:protein-S-isoprenylcysteine O-methyltransferase Ste14